MLVFRVALFFPPPSSSFLFWLWSELLVLWLSRPGECSRVLHELAQCCDSFLGAKDVW
ncbi:uncharacterized protein BT62DRAFT_936324 [Guyanagaster necrorhizus]|uniref:Secreted protein n=1 Tax=Guyanagaster necrorhizus TaxID=856835 RepID=A0A9P7VLQ2_9AGAR|nr:uncharacterized protein BT62DRAFT_936324 [Guyanagaster necrorhizus MCA 3950]KAG7442214.1 hypothetical protein BT62DRAFT_936324 [Guyanagaster necrorhizus MCA 3950]